MQGNPNKYLSDPQLKLCMKFELSSKEKAITDIADSILFSGES
jgi:hypothetical protein